MGNETSKPAVDADPNAVPGRTQATAAPRDPPARSAVFQDKVITVVTAATPATAVQPPTFTATTQNNRWSLPSIPFYSSSSSASDPSTLTTLPPGTNVDGLPVWYQDLIRLPKPSTTPKLSLASRPVHRSRPQTPSASSSHAHLASDPSAVGFADNDDHDSTHQSSTTSLSTAANPPGAASRGPSWLSLFATTATSPSSSPTSPPALHAPSASVSAPISDAPLVVGHLGHATNMHLRHVASRQRKLGALVADVQAQATGVAGEAVARASKAGAVVAGVREYVGLQARMDALDKELGELIARVGQVVGRDKVRFLDPASESESESASEGEHGGPLIETNA